MHPTWLTRHGIQFVRFSVDEHMCIKRWLGINIFQGAQPHSSPFDPRFELVA